eukprot:2571946-Alexandrium_andersonii.AAC.1
MRSGRPPTWSPCRVAWLPRPLPDWQTYGSGSWLACGSLTSSPRPSQSGSTSWATSSSRPPGSGRSG